MEHQNRRTEMLISEYNVPGFCAGKIQIAEITRHQSFVVCIACDERMDKLVKEFENKFLPGRFADVEEIRSADPADRKKPRVIHIYDPDH